MPNEVSILFNLGAALLSTEDLDGAVACFTQILAQDPHDAYSLAQLGQAQHMRGDLGPYERMCTLTPLNRASVATHSPAHPLTRSPAHPLTHPLAHPLAHSPTRSSIL